MANYKKPHSCALCGKPVWKKSRKYCTPSCSYIARMQKQRKWAANQKISDLKVWYGFKRI